MDYSESLDELMASSFDHRGHWAQALGPDWHLENKEVMRIIEECLDHLSLQQRSAFVLKEVEGEASQSICNILDVSATNLRQLLFRGKNQLKSCVDKGLSL